MAEAISALDATISQLEGELSNDPRYILLNDLRAARAAYETARHSSGSNPAEASKGSSETARLEVSGGIKLAPGRARAYELVKEALVGHVEPVRTRDLYDLVEQNGVELPGGMNNLSSMLGRHPKTFKSHGRRGWTLKISENEAEPSSGANGEGSAPLFNSSQEGGDRHEATTTHH